MPATTATTTVSITGTLNIGEAPNGIPIKLDTVLPPKTPGVYVFDYTATDLDTAKTIKMGPFFTWATSQLGAVGISASDLPPSLQTLSVNVQKLHLDTKGTYDVEVQLGTETAAGKWSATWEPVTGLPLSLDGVTFKATNIAQA